LDVIRHVELLKQLELLAKDIHLCKKLDLARTITQLKKAGFAETSSSHQAPKDYILTTLCDRLYLRFVVALIFILRASKFLSDCADEQTLITSHTIFELVCAPQS